jgi:peroxiredoxin Q/BCP
MITLKAGDPAPDFTLPDQNGAEFTLSEFRGQWVLLYFYPKDNTPGCTTEACELRDNFGELQRLGVQVLGISADTVASHASFALKLKLPFLLLADPEKTACNAYGVWGPQKFLGVPFQGVSRSSFLIDPQGRIAKVYPKVKPADHAREVITDLKQFTAPPAQA